MNLLKAIISVVRGNAMIISLNDREISLVKGSNLSKTQAKLMALKVAKCLA